MWCIVFFMCVCMCVCNHVVYTFMTRQRVTPIHPQTSFLKGKSPENEVAGRGFPDKQRSYIAVRYVVVGIFLRSQLHITHQLLCILATLRCSALRLVWCLDLTLFDSETSHLRQAVGDLGLKLPCKKGILQSEESPVFFKELFFAQLPSCCLSPKKIIKLVHKETFSYIYFACKTSCQTYQQSCQRRVLSSISPGVPRLTFTN